MSRKKRDEWYSLEAKFAGERVGWQARETFLF